MSRSISRAIVLGSAALLLSGVIPAAAEGSSPDDPVFEQGLQWGLERIGAPEAWTQGTGDGTTIAVIDSGVDLDHEDLRDKVVAHVSCIGATTATRCLGSAQDDNGHGSHVAGIALASTGNGAGIAGVAPDADLMAVRVLADKCDTSGDCSASGSADDAATGVRWAADNGADVINLSLGGGTLQSASGCSLCDAVEYAWSEGAIPVVAAGNDEILPAGLADEHVVIVTATTRTDARAAYSSASAGLLRSARWPIAAPGGEEETSTSACASTGTPKGVVSTYWVSGHQDSYACLAGTSMAAPHVAGALAVLLGLGQSPQAAVDRLLDTAEDLGPAGRDDQFGVGLVDLARAVSDAPGNTTTSTTTTRTGETTVPSPSPPDAIQAAPFSPASSPSDDDVPRWLVALSVGALVTSSTVAIATARRFTRRSAGA